MIGDKQKQQSRKINAVENRDEELNYRIMLVDGRGVGCGPRLCGRTFP